MIRGTERTRNIRYQVMKALTHIIFFIVQIIVFFGVVQLTAWGYSYGTMERYQEGENPTKLFKIVVQRDGELTTLNWRDYQNPGGKRKSQSFHLPTDLIELEGGKVFVEVKEETWGQRVKVEETLETVLIISRYSVQNNDVFPESLQIFGFTSAVLGILPGAVAVWLVGKWRRRMMKSWFPNQLA